MSDFRDLLQILDDIQETEIIELYDSVDLELSDDFVIETGVVGFTDDGIILEADAATLEFLDINHILYESEELMISEAEYQGRKVQLGKPMAGDVKKSKVYVRKPNGKVVKVNFGDKNMKIKKSNPKRRKSFRARHNCQNPGPRWKARYWSCRAW